MPRHSMDPLSEQRQQLEKEQERIQREMPELPRSSSSCSVLLSPLFFSLSGRIFRAKARATTLAFLGDKEGGACGRHFKRDFPFLHFNFLTG